MARSKDVYAVLGLMCIDPEFRRQFFSDWRPTAKKFMGSISQDEADQLARIAGEGVGNRDLYIKKLDDECRKVQNALGCPVHPCPDPDPWVSS